MRNWISTMVLFLAASPAFADRAVVDCGSAGKGEVTITTKNARASHERAAELAWQCFKDRNVDVIKERLESLKAAKNVNDSCGSLDKLQMLPLTSWIADRPDSYGQSGGDSKILVREPLSCDGVGTGLFGGYVSGTAVIMKITETFKADLEKETSRQIITITLEGPIDFTAKKKVEPAPAKGSRTE